MTMPARPTASRRRRRLGLSLVEVLVSLAIAATLLVAAAAAFNSSAGLVRDNDEFFRASQAARVSLRQILEQARRGSVSRTWSATSVRMVTADGDDVSYTYVPASARLTLVTHDVTTDADFVLASNVAGLTFDVEPGTDADGAACVARVTVVITVRVGDSAVTLSGAAAPRRNLIF